MKVDLTSLIFVWDGMLGKTFADDVLLLMMMLTMLQYGTWLDRNGFRNSDLQEEALTLAIILSGPFSIMDRTIIWTNNLD